MQSVGLPVKLGMLARDATVPVQLEGDLGAPA
jgi:hypothetical protein